MLYLSEPVHKWHDRHACRPHLWLFGYSHHRHVATIAAAHHDQLFGIDVAALHHEVDRSEIVLKVSASHIKTVCVHELLAESS